MLTFSDISLLLLNGTANIEEKVISFVGLLGHFYLFFFTLELADVVIVLIYLVKLSGS